MALDASQEVSLQWCRKIPGRAEYHDLRVESGLYVVLKSDVGGTPIEFFRGEPKLDAPDICIGNIADRRGMTGCVHF